MKISTTPKHILDFDVETISAGFADPNWVPQRITVIAWSWIGSREVRYATRRDTAASMFIEFLKDLRMADMVTGHNLIRFDLPVLNADLIRTGFSALPTLMVQDTMRVPKAKGLKKGQDNMARLMGVRARKRNMDWQEWDEAYEWDDLIAGGDVSWAKVIERCVTDVKQHKLMRKAMLEEGLLKPPVEWKS